MTATTTTTTTAGRVAPAVPLPDDITACLLGTACPLPLSPLGRGWAVLAEVIDSEATAEAMRSALTYPGARNALVTAVSLCQHGETFADAASDEGDGTVLASFLSLAVATARLVRAEDDAVDAAGRPERGDDPWRTYVERCGRLALVRSLRAARRDDAGPDSRDAMYRTARADDPSVTAPRAPRKSRSPGAAVPNVPRSRSERIAAEVQRAANVWADTVGAGPDAARGVPPILGSASQAFAQSIAGDPCCPLAYGPADADGHRHACTARCWPLGGFDTYSPRQISGTVRGRQVRAGERIGLTIPVPIDDADNTYPLAGPTVSRDRDEVLVWHAFHAFPLGCAVQRSHGDTDTDARLPDKVKTRLRWTPRRARQHLTSGDKRFTPTTFVRDRGTATRTPARTAEHVAAGGTFDQDVRTSYGSSTFVGWRRVREATAPSEVPARKVARTRAVRAMTTQQRAVITLVCDAALLVMFDGRPRTAHRDETGAGYVVTRTGDGILSLVTPDGITSPLRTDPRGMAADVRTAITA